jgi:hypothetical protein
MMNFEGQKRIWNIDGMLLASKELTAAENDARNINNA